MQAKSPDGRLRCSRCCLSGDFQLRAAQDAPLLLQRAVSVESRHRGATGGKSPACQVQYTAISSLVTGTVSDTTAVKIRSGCSLMPRRLPWWQGRRSHERIGSMRTMKLQLACLRGPCFAAKRAGPPQLYSCGICKKKSPKTRHWGRIRFSRPSRSRIQESEVRMVADYQYHPFGVGLIPREVKRSGVLLVDQIGLIQMVSIETCGNGSHLACTTCADAR